MSVRHAIGRKHQRAIKGDTNPQLEQAAYNPPRPIGSSWQHEFPPVEPRERREEAAETHLINGQNYRAQHSAKSVQNSMKSNKVYGDAKVLDANKRTENGLKHMLDKFITDTPEFNNNRFFTQQEPVIYGGDDEFLAQHLHDENQRDIAAREDYAEQEEEREARDAEEADRHQRELDALEAEHQQRLEEEAANRIIRVRRHKKAVADLEAKRAIAAAKLKAQQEDSEADPEIFAAGGGGAPPTGKIGEFGTFPRTSLRSRSGSVDSAASDVSGLTSAAADYSAAGLGSASNLDELVKIGHKLHDPNIQKEEQFDLKNRLGALGVPVRGVKKRDTLINNLNSHLDMLASHGATSTKVKNYNAEKRFVGSGGGKQGY